MTKKQKRMQKAVKYLREYFETYHEQTGYLDYGDKMLIDDVLYGLGVALDDKYKYGQGFDAFKSVLRKHLG